MTKYYTLHRLFTCGILALVRAGSSGLVESSYLQRLDLTLSAKQQYPLALIMLLTRYAEDLIWANKVTEAEEMLNFTIDLTEGRPEASELRKGKARAKRGNMLPETFAEVHVSSMFPSFATREALFPATSSSYYLMMF